MRASDSVLKVLYLLCALALLAELLIHRHAYIAFTGWPGFDAVLALISLPLILLGAALLRALLQRPSRYYADSAVDSESHPVQDLGLLADRSGESAVGRRHRKVDSASTSISPMHRHRNGEGAE